MHDTNRQIFICRDGSYDTHDTELRILSDRLSAVDACIAAFTSAMQEIGLYDNVTLFTTSDFGRSLLENTTGGTDHAWGGHHFVIGGAVKGGDLYGTFPELVAGGDDDINAIGNWIPTISTSQYLATMATWLDVPPSSLPTIFPELPNFSKATLPIMR